MAKVKRRRLDAECLRRECDGECGGDGWCSAVYTEVRRKTERSIRAASWVIFAGGVGFIGFLVGLGLHAAAGLLL